MRIKLTNAMCRAGFKRNFSLYLYSYNLPLEFKKNIIVMEYKYIQSHKYILVKTTKFDDGWDYGCSKYWSNRKQYRVGNLSKDDVGNLYMDLFVPEGGN